MSQEVGAPPRVAIYCRKSVVKKDEDDKLVKSVESQREAARSYIACRGWCEAKAYTDEGYSGANTRRPAFDAMMKDIRAGKIDVVLVWKLDRLSRSIVDFVGTHQELQRHGVDFVSVQENFATNSPMGRMVMNMLVVFAQYEREVISERTRTFKKYAAEAGHWAGGRPPLGYVLQDKRLEVDPVAAAAIRELAELYLQFGSAHDAGQMLVARHGDDPDHPASRRRWSKHTVAKVLRSPVYAGYIVHEGKRHEGQHEPIIPREMFEEIERRFKAKTRRGRAGRSPNYPLAGSLKCLHCGRACTPHTSRRTNKHGEPVEYRYYRCSTKTKYGADACATGEFNADRLEEKVIARLKQALSDPRFVPTWEAAVQERIHTELALLADEDRRIASALLRAVDDEEAAERISVMRRRQEVVAQRCEDLSAAGESVGWVVEVLKNFDAVWAELTPHNRQQLCLYIFGRITVDKTGHPVAMELLPSFRESIEPFDLPDPRPTGKTKPELRLV